MPQQPDNHISASKLAGSMGDSSNKFGRIIIARHGKPAKDRELGPRLTARQYLDWWASYEQASLKDDGQGPSKQLLEATKNAPFINTSIRPRAIETAQAIALGREVRQDSIFIEAPLPPPDWSDFWKFLPKRWNVISRVSWCFGHSGGQESQVEARKRAKDAVEKLINQAASGEDTVLAAHGWFNRMMRPELKRRGWKCTHDGGDSYWSFRIYEKHS
ncbi:histidine phosphatase family protein [Hirschia baltica]|uniref:Phosphoglycerate mutase n=1 Tax=Hirschia baltica (strain ATCC 49814 / DSM 5838 / IFAM 1418) TaxID=582402 RepID=C6XI51_HIRBI|nr:histidine phosphatase family protein [Hirschia baltica]ACT58877.1 Phosphoglycerate mutase [Hirschia baltica ATCC 49814]